MSEPLAILGLIRQEVEAAVDVILTAAGAGLQEMPAISKVDAAAAERLERHLLRILESCAFQDLTGQRLQQLCALFNDAPSTSRPQDPLLNGPAPEGYGLDQAAADRLFLEP
ncbi:hypothetical protein [Brevundimonas sp.]|uniref:hypothetical protein n=1 Tax=Brevundimonas sp. TaxID=1871086 RepID=UPI002FCA651C